MTASRIVWNPPPSTIARRVAARKRAIRAGILQIAEAFALHVQGQAQQGATWQDRTTNARQGLTGKAIPQGEAAVLIILFHSMDYGKWLELKRAFAGRYAILLKTMEANYPMLMRELQAFIGG